jgi:signal transduction histidine kinase/tetratricopeptide (TPR) repeat protein
MRKLLVSFVFFHCISNGILAQSVTTNSLKQLLSTAKEDTAHVQLMLRLARAYVYSEPDTAFLIGSNALELSRKINYKKGESGCLRIMSLIFANTGNYPKALEFGLQALKIAEETKDDREIATTFSNLSDAYFYQGDIKRSLDYSYRTIAIYQKLHNTQGLNTVYINMGDTYEKIDQLDSALAYVKLGYPMAVKANNLDLQATSLNNFGNVFLKLGKIDSAMMYYRESIPRVKQIKNDEGLCETYLGMAKIFLLQKKTDSSLYYAKLSFSIGKNDGFTDRVLAASNFLAEYYKSARNVDSAYAYQSATIAAKDSLFSQQKANEIQSMNYDEDIRQQQIEDAKQQERVRAKQNALIGGLIALLIVAFLLVRNNRQKRKANLQLQKQKEEIDHKAHELSVQKDNLEQSYNNVEQLGEIGRKVTSSLSVEKIISTVYDNVNALMDAAVFGIGIYNDELKRIEFPATYEDGQPLPFYYNSIDDHNRFAVICFKENKEIVMGNIREDYSNYIKQVQTPHEGEQPVSLIFLPLAIKENKLGVITVQSFKENAYSDYHLFMLRNIAIYTAIALENAESFERLQQTVTRLQSAQAQLVQSEKMASLGELTAGIAHEIQNPLIFVNNFSEVNNELIEEMNEEDDISNVKIIASDIKRNNDKISFHGKRADAIVKNMLQHSRRAKGIKELTDINALCEEYLRLAYHGLRAKDKSFNAKYETNFDNNVGKINIVPQDIGRVVLNLINNAFYAVDEKKKQHQNGYEPTVALITAKKDGKVEIKVKDNGNGISQKIVDKIFQPFFTTKPTGQGTGLGLSLSYDIIKAHGGELKVENNESAGAIFIIAIPFTH